MPIYMSLLIDGIEGDGSVNQLHKGEINVISFSWGISTGEAASGGGGGTGKAQFDDLVIVKQMDQASPRLMLACSSGRHSKFAIFKSSCEVPAFGMGVLSTTTTDATVRSGWR